MSGSIYIEESGTPIYTRIAKALGAQLSRMGMQVLIVKPKGFSQDSFIAFLREQKASSIYLTNAGSNAIQGQVAGQAMHYFEHFPGRLIFLHQDSILSGLSYMQALAKLQAWQRVAARSAHLCIEPDNVKALQEAGIGNSVVVPHASEIAPVAPLLTGFEHQASFVGHVVPSVYRQSSGSTQVDALIDQQIKRRQNSLAQALQDDLAAFSNQALSCLGSEADSKICRLAHTLWLRGQMMNQSLQFRGWVFEQAQLDDLCIFGGDPAYLHGVERSLRIERPGLSYQSAVYDMDALSHIFRSSLVNVNISSIQFDHAVVNRFHDVVMAGGLCLTDRRDGLPQLTRHHEDVSFASLQELQDKIKHFCHPSRHAERAALISSMQKEIVEHSGYPLLAHEIGQMIARL